MSTMTSPQETNSPDPIATTANFTSRKSFWDYPCAHRQWKHTGNCALVHGYSRSFHFIFGAQQRDQCGFVVDYGDLMWLRGFLQQNFDHTLVLPSDEPFLETFKELEAHGACKVVVLPYGAGMEDTAQFVCEYADEVLRLRTKGRAWVISVEAQENDKNSSTYVNPNAGFKGWL